MKRLLIAGIILGAAVMAGVAIAASTGSGSAKSGTFVVFARQVPGAGKVLVDAKGRALYRNDQERSGMVLCTGACASIWKPLLVRGIDADLSSTSLHQHTPRLQDVGAVCDLRTYSAIRCSTISTVMPASRM